MKNFIIIITLALLSISSFGAKKAEIVTLSEDNTLVLNSAFDAKSVAILMDEASKMDSALKSNYPIYLVLYTPGGSIQAGLELYDFLKGLNRPIHTITLFAASMGFQTVQHLDKRYITRYGVLMGHKAKGTFQGEFGGGPSQIDSRYGMWLRRIEMMDQMTVDRSSFLTSLKQFYTMYAPELWLNGAEAVKLGLADNVAIIKCDASLQGVKTVVANLGLFSIELQFPKCPSRTAPLGASASLMTNQGNMSLIKFLSSGGKFGKGCKTTSQPTLNQFGELIKSAIPAELCALDTEITYKSIIKAKEDKVKFLNRNLKDHVIRSY